MVSKLPILLRAELKEERSAGDRARGMQADLEAALEREKKGRAESVRQRQGTIAQLKAQLEEAGASPYNSYCAHRNCR